MREGQGGAGVASGVRMETQARGGQQAARFHRETDRGLRRTMGAALACSAVIVAGVLGVVALKVHQVRLSYQLDALRITRAAAEERTRVLHVELATLRSLARIEDKARGELGMVPPAADQVQLAREFVPGGRGVAAAGQPRATAALTPRGAEPRTR
jgi:cell division protein FtsL